MEIEGNNTVMAWKLALRDVMNRGNDFSDVDNRICRESLNFLITIKNPEMDITKPMEIINSLKKWTFPPIEEIASIILTKKSSPAYRYSYGPRLFNFADSVNQIDDFVIPLLKKDPNSRRAIAVVWDSRSDSTVYEKDIPGWILTDFKYRDKKLHVLAYIRSNELFFGWSANIYQVFVLQKYVAEKLHFEIGSLSTFSTSSHIFKDNFDDINMILQNDKP